MNTKRIFALFTVKIPVNEATDKTLTDVCDTLYKYHGSIEYVSDIEEIEV